MRIGIIGAMEEEIRDLRAEMEIEREETLAGMPVTAVEKSESIFRPQQGSRM